MAKLVGTYAAFTVSGEASTGSVYGAHTWNLDENAELLDGTDFRSPAGFKEYKPGTIKGWTCSVQGHFDSSEAKFYGTTPGFSAGQTVTGIRCYIDATKFYGGNGIITSVNIVAARNGEVDWTLNIQGTGSLTYPASD